MNGPRKDIDPATELAEEDDEQTLPELEPEAAADAAIDLAAVAGSLAVGRAAITRHARHAPSSPGVDRMIDANGEVL
jgi:excinuclease ABC subunit C